MTGEPVQPLELDLAAARLREDRRLTVGLYAATIAFTLSLWVMDVLVVGRDTPRLLALLGIRVAFAVALYFVIAMMRRSDERERYERVTAAGAYLIFTEIVLLTLLRGPAEYTSTYMQIVAVGICYVAAPVALRRVTVLMLSFSAVFLGMIFFYNAGVPVTTRNAFTIALATTNVLGYLVARRRGQLADREAAIWSASQRARGELETALAEVRTLQGLLSMCMHCHRILTDDGEWQQLETYVSARSEATFSHGLCPVCADEHYPS